MTIGNKILELRQQKKLTQQELAQILNVTNLAISRWENGNTMPDIDMIKKIADTFNISIGELYDSIDETKTKNYENYDFGKIWVYKKYTIISIILLIIGVCLFWFLMPLLWVNDIFVRGEKFLVLLTWICYIVLPIIAVSFQIVQFLNLLTYSRTKFYRKEYNKALMIYGCSFLGVAVICSIIYMIQWIH
ncbi:MAG TPA: helix-turn-helix transcriptional regulator [Candidatus Onthovivens sp.]|nr:helix-turn-helix transcriptional regulator [Candidatus Onthovivens sp.]